MARNASSTALALALLASAPAAILAYTDAEVDAKVAGIHRDMNAGWLVICGVFSFPKLSCFGEYSPVLGSRELRDEIRSAP